MRALYNPPLMAIDPALPEDHLQAQIPPADHQVSPETARLARAASIISLGNIASRVLGLLREMLRANYFGAGGAVDAITVATLVPTYLYDLLIGGMATSSLIPVFSEFAADRKEELWRLVSAILTLTVIVMAVFTLIIEIFARQIAVLLSGGSSPEVLDLTANLLRITVPAVLFLSLSGVLSALLYALKRFTAPALTAAVFNAGIVVITFLFHRQLGVASMAVGLLIGAIAQLLIQLPALKDANLYLSLKFRHTGLKRIGMLFLPIALGLMVDVLIVRPVLVNLASQTGEGANSWRTYATYLIQLPQGLVSTAVSTAILPTLAFHAANADEAFNKTLAQGLRLVSVLIIPATVGLFVLAYPTVALVFEHGSFTPFDTQVTTLAVQLYLIGLPFAALDLLLVFAFYARNETLTPSLIGVVAGILSVLVAILLLPIFGLFSLMIAETARHLVHTLISAIILRRHIGSLAQHGVMRAINRSLAASLIMGAVAYAVLLPIQRYVPTGAVQEVLAVALPSAIGGAVYIGLIILFRIEEMYMLLGVIRRKLGL